MAYKINTEIAKCFAKLYVERESRLPQYEYKFTEMELAEKGKVCDIEFSHGEQAARRNFVRENRIVAGNNISVFCGTYRIDKVTMLRETKRRGPRIRLHLSEPVALPAR